MKIESNLISIYFSLWEEGKEGKRDSEISTRKHLEEALARRNRL